MASTLSNERSSQAAANPADSSTVPLSTPASTPASTPMSRRGFLKGMGVVGAGAVIVDYPLLRAAEAPPATQPDAADAGNRPIKGDTDIVLSVNGADRHVRVEPRTTLLVALRDRLDPPITGPKLVCDAGACGACTVLLSGKPVYACMILAIDAVGKPITTVEGIGTPDKLSPIQAAFIEHDALMCGFCTPGFVTTLTALLDKNPHPTEAEIRKGCAGNFCRCGTYPRIFEAAMSVSRKNT